MKPYALSGADVGPKEKERVETLQTYGIDEALQDPVLDRITNLAANIFRVRMSMVSLVEEARQVFAVRWGTDLCETDRESSFCAHALLGRSILEVPDAQNDPRFATNRLVTGPPFIRFYAGCPLVAPNGHVLGALCIVDTKPRRALSIEEKSNLQDLAALVMDKLELRRLDLAWQASPVRFERLANVSPDAIVCVDERARITFWNSAAERLFGFAREEMINASVARLAPEPTVSRLLQLGKDEASLASGSTAEIDIVSASGVLVPVEVSTSVWREGNEASFCLVLRDVTERRRNEERLYRLAHIDALTNLPNRTLFRDRLEASLADSTGGGLFMLDLDGFKDVNDSFGHAAGDAMLMTAAQRLHAVLPSSALAARMGGDEFAVLLPNVHDTAQLGMIADAVIDTLSQPAMIDGETVVIGASVGIARFPDDGRTVRELLSCADLALYEAKTHGKHCRRFFTSRLRDAALARQAYLTELPRATDRQEWVLFYEPVVRIADGALLGAQVQLRWQHPRHGLLAPAAFASALQTSPVGARIGQWMLNTACRQLAIWRTTQPHFRLSLAVLDAQFRAGDLGDRVRASLAREGLPAAALELEITEAILLRGDAQTVSTLADLRAQGVSIALDDYGTGQASFELLKNAPITRLKMDASFVQGMTDIKSDAAIIRVILYLGKSLDLAVTAKGVATEAQFRQLLKKGCEEAQGAWLGEPLPACDFFRLTAPAREPGELLHGS